MKKFEIELTLPYHVLTAANFLYECNRHRGVRWPGFNDSCKAMDYVTITGYSPKTDRIKVTYEEAYEDQSFYDKALNYQEASERARKIYEENKEFLDKVADKMNIFYYGNMAVHEDDPANYDDFINNSLSLDPEVMKEITSKIKIRFVDYCLLYVNLSWMQYQKRFGSNIAKTSRFLMDVARCIGPTDETTMFRKFMKIFNSDEELLYYFIMVSKCSEPRYLKLVPEHVWEQNNGELVEALLKDEYKGFRLTRKMGTSFQYAALYRFKKSSYVYKKAAEFLKYNPKYVAHGSVIDAIPLMVNGKEMTPKDMKAAIKLLKGDVEQFIEKIVQNNE